VADLVKKANERQKALLGREQVRIQKVLKAYKLVYADLNREIDGLVREMQVAQAKGETVNTEWIKKRDRLESLRKQTIATMSRFGGELEALLQSEVKLEAQKGADTMVETVADAGIAFDRLPTEAVQAIVDQTISDPHLRRAIDRMGPETWRKVESEVIGGLGAGRAPSDIGRRITEATGMPIARGLMLARTIPINANREAAHQSRIRNAAILDGWIWFTSQKDNVCPFCRTSHGRLFPLTQRQSSHPNCACTSLPQIPGMEDEIAEDMKLYGPKDPEERIAEIEKKLADGGISNAYKYKLRKELEQLKGGVQPSKPAPTPKPEVTYKYSDAEVEKMLSRKDELDKQLRTMLPAATRKKLLRELEELQPKLQTALDERTGKVPPSPAPKPKPDVSSPERQKLLDRKKELETKLQAGSGLSSTYKYKIRKELDQLNLKLAATPAPTPAVPAPSKTVTERAPKTAKAPKKRTGPSGPEVRAKLEELAKTFPESREVRLLSDKHIAVLKQFTGNRPTPGQLQSIQAYNAQAEAKQSPRMLETMRSALYADEPGDFESDFSKTPASEQRTMAVGWTEFRRLVGKKTLAKVPKEHTQYGFSRSNTPKFVGIEGRSHYDPGSREVRIGRGRTPRTVVHELGHWLEFNLPDARKKAVKFWQKRTADSQWTEMRELYPDRNYRPGERLKPNSFTSPYMGKVYTTARKGKEPRLPDFTATEIVSMGLEEMWANPLQFARTDPDYFDFIWSLIRDD
jgi:hypothetical protein